MSCEISLSLEINRPSEGNKNKPVRRFETDIVVTKNPFPLTQDVYEEAQHDFINVMNACPASFSTPPYYESQNMVKNTDTPVTFTAPFVLAASCLKGNPTDNVNTFWADPPNIYDIPQTSSDKDRIKKWNATCGANNNKLRVPLRERTSYEGDGRVYFLNDADDKEMHKKPLNPILVPLYQKYHDYNLTFSTGMRGRGSLGQWGPNPAADPILVRKLDGRDWEVVMIYRKDTKVDMYGRVPWALPGGMVDSVEFVPRVVGKDVKPDRQKMGAALRELGEEAWENFKPEYKDIILENATPLFTGYVDDPRNTDNAWMESSCFLFDMHATEKLKEIAETMTIEGMDDARAANWINVCALLERDEDGTPVLPMFSETHRYMLQKAWDHIDNTYNQ